MFIPETRPDTLWSLVPQSQGFFSGWPEECRPMGKGRKRSVKMGRYGEEGAITFPDYVQLELQSRRRYPFPAACLSGSLKRG